jgi:hypothetical protein
LGVVTKCLEHGFFWFKGSHLPRLWEFNFLHLLQDQFQKEFKVGNNRCQIAQLHKILRMMSYIGTFHGYLWTHNFLLTQTWKNKVGDQGVGFGSTSQP